MDGCIYNPKDGLKAGVISEKIFSLNNPKVSLQLGVFYHYRQISDYNNEPYYPTFQRVIHVNTNVTQHLAETQLIAKYRPEHGRFSAGLGANVSFLFASKTDQIVNDALDSTNYQFILFNYEIRNNSGIHRHNRLNIAPVVNIGFRLTPKIELEYYLSYDLRSPQQKYLNYEVYHLCSNTILITFKIN